MEKRNTILLTVIAVATLLVAVVGATFAYFAQSGSFDATANLTANTAAASSSFIATGSDITLSVTAANMVYATAGNQVSSTAQENAITVSFKSGSSENLSCTYKVYYEWDSTSDAYTMTTGAAGNKEFTYEFAKKTGGTASTFTGYSTETNFEPKDASRHYVGGTQTISNASSETATLDTYDITVRFYNLTQEQSGEAAKAGKTWKIKFGISDVIC